MGSRLALAGLAAGVVALAGLVPGAGAQAPDGGAREEPMPVRIVDLLARVSKETGRIFIYDADVESVHVRYLGERDVAPEARYAIVRHIAALEALAFVTAGAGTPHEVVKVVRIGDAILRGPLVEADAVRKDPGLLPDDGEPRTLLIRLRRALAHNLAQAVDDVVERSRVRVVAVAGAEALICAGDSGTLKRVLDLADALDAAASGRPIEAKLVRLQGAVPDALAGVLRARATEQAVGPTIVVPVGATTGPAIVVGGGAEDLARLEAWIKELDVAQPAKGTR